MLIVSHMSKAQLFKNAMQKLQDSYADVEDMTDMKNWCMVHATKYMPREHQDGTKYIPSTGMATDFENPRTTVHTTLNHVVTAHAYGSWDDMPIVVLAPYQDVVKENGNPAEIATADTYWSVNPNRGLVLPSSAYIIQPSDDVLYKIGEHGATYKRDNYTDEEIKTILELMTESEREEYKKYENADFKDYEIERELQYDERLKKMYESATDKRAFMRGLFEEDRFGMLSKYLRNAVVRMSMDKKGFRKLGNSYDGSEENNAVVKAANIAGIPATAANKGHAGSIYSEMEDNWEQLYRCLKIGSYSKEDGGIMNAPNTDVLFNNLVNNDRFSSVIRNSIINNKPVDFMNIYEKEFMDNIKRRQGYAQLSMENIDNETQRYNDEYKKETTPEDIKKNISERIKENEQKKQFVLSELKKLLSIKAMADYDKNLSETFSKNAARLSSQYDAWRSKLVGSPEYAKLVEKLKQYYANMGINIAQMNRE